MTEYYIIKLFNKFPKRDCRPGSVVGIGKTHKTHKNAHSLVIGMQISAIGQCVEFLFFINI